MTLAVALVGLLVGLLFGLREGIRHQVTTFVDNAGADVYVASRDSRSFVTGGPPALPVSLAGELERQPGVEQAAPIVSSEAILRLHHQRVATQLVGFEPGRLGSP